MLIVWAIFRGDEGPNKYGPDPRQPTPQQPEIKLGGKYIPHGTPNNSFPNYLAGIPTWTIYLLSAIGSLLCILFTVEVYLRSGRFQSLLSSLELNTDKPLLLTA